MQDRIRAAFDSVHAEDALKERTRRFLAGKTRNYAHGPAPAYRRLAPVLACFLFLLLGLGRYWLYFLPTSYISIDVNPSIELGINRFDKVVSVEGYNADGEALAAALDIKYLDYDAALEQVLASDAVSACLSQDGLVTIGVIGSDAAHCQHLLDQVRTCADGHGNTYCYAASYDDLSQAHEAGLSYGKYRALLEAQALDPSITAEDVSQMTMRELYDLIERLSGGEAASPASGAGTGHGHSHGRQHGKDH